MNKGNGDYAKVSAWLQSWQNTLIEEFTACDGVGRFQRDSWKRPGGGGDSCVMKNGMIWEQVGVNYSAVRGDDLPPSALKNRPELRGAHYQVAGVSVVAHPLNPYTPTVHANFRFFTTQLDGRDLGWWFGGGYDLTPYYGYIEDCRHWHRVARNTCHPFGAQLYPRFKRDCDDYFYLAHRGEARGIGGIFFDNMNAFSFDKCFEMVQALGDSFLKAYMPIVRRRCDTPYGERERSFQLYRRGRYVEFNLLWDRGTRFGIESGGRAESILMSLPPGARWEYGWKPDAGSDEALLCDKFLRPRDWLTEED